MSTLSIVIPAYNEESYLKSCLQAIARQTVKADEVIVVDNNSIDKTADIARSFPFVRLITETRQGLYFSRQAGMAAATGDIIGRIDADTVVEKNWVEVIKDTFEDESVSSATGPVGYHDWAVPLFALRVEDIFLRIAKAGKYHFLMGANMAIRRSSWQIIEHELCNEPFLFEDIDIATHLKSHGLVPSYVPAMRAMVSGRRFDDNPKDFIKYIGGHTRTLEHHNEYAAGSYFAEVSFATAYFIGGKPLYKAYDPEERRFSFKRLLEPSAARPDPMAVE